MKLRAILAYMLLGLLVAVGYKAWSAFQHFGHLEDNAQKLVTAQELQAWASDYTANAADTNILASAENGCPEKLKDLVPGLGPNVALHAGDTNSPPWVMLSWGNSFLGSAGFEIGPTNFSGIEPNSKSWAPGVYFFRKK